ncbi:uncharacterized protein LOC114401731 isoform X2 [Glycine soja]|uniref:uncharacterized protein LOC114401731 isoform X2 n=1 Tax=Glycine soja TaxID=3848 RepID=UPI00103E8719|nr:uncharacterized protein LOC114401731 isoform X2 [Glycine soja]
MAPKRRPKKGESRMDAALDAMKPYGFPIRLVRTTVNSLLKVYGGNGGWFFIEESAYSLLIETLLEKQANSSPQDGLIEANPDGPNEVTPAGCSNSALLACSNTQTSDDTLLTNQAADTVSSSSGTGIQLPINGVDTVSAKTEIGSELPIKSVDISSVPSEPANQPLIKAASETPIEAFKESEFQPVKKLALAENHVSKSPQLGTGLSDKRYKPCYGWISNDDEEEEELIELPLAPWLSGVN